MQHDDLNNVHEIGKKLSIGLGCAVKLSMFSRTVLLCNHNIAFSITRLRESDEWSWAKEKHDKEVS